MRQNELHNKLLLLRRFQLNDFSIRFYQHTQKFKLNFMISELTMWVKGLTWKGTSFSMLGRGMCLLANSSYFRSKTWVIATMPKAVSLTLKWSIVTKSWKKGRISSILSSSHWFRNSMALKQKNIIKSIKFIIYNRYIEEQFYPWFKFSFTSSESSKIVTNRQTLQQSNSLSRETDSEPKYIKYEPKLISTIFLDRFTSSYSKILVRTITRLIRDHFGGDVQKGHACHAHSLSRFSFLSTTTIILFSVQVKSYPSTLDKVI